MFWPDVIDLKMFYASAQGRVVAESIYARIRECWGEPHEGERILGVGFTHHYLAHCLGHAERVINLMPAAQGAIHWPMEQTEYGNLTFMASEGEIPLAEESVHRILLVHSLENTEQLRQIMRELWRVLAPGGRILAVVPNRQGKWARQPGGPFAHGHSFTASQLRKLMREHQFTPSESHYALFTPPLRLNFILKSRAVFESIGNRLCPVFGGVLLMEGEKQIYAARAETTARTRKKNVYVPATQPVLG